MFKSDVYVGIWPWNRLGSLGSPGLGSPMSGSWLLSLDTELISIDALCIPDAVLYSDHRRNYNIPYGLGAKESSLRYAAISPVLFL